MAVKEPRQAVVSIRLSDDEQDRLRKIADQQGMTVSDVVRGYVNQEMAGPLPRGESIGAHRQAGPTGLGGLQWSTGEGAQVDGQTITVGPLES